MAVPSSLMVHFILLRRMNKLNGHSSQTLTIQVEALLSFLFIHLKFILDYNGWKSCYCKKGLYFFCLDGTIIYCVIDCPGSWHDGLLFDQALPWVSQLPQGVWILGDSGFPRIPGKLERARKANELLSPDQDRRRFQLGLEKFCSQIRIGAEWGIKDLKRSWGIFQCPFPSDDGKKRLLVWKLVMRLHNFRQREMRVGQIGSVFLPDEDE